ncbi:MAG TPA: glycosyltransferase [Candidatus Xenobia bacterium]
MSLTILLPVKNYHPVFLHEAVQSVFQQTSPDWKLMVLVERRDQAHFSQLLKAALQDGRVTLRTSEGRRLGGALNTGMLRADTTFVAILLGDDRWADNAVGVLNRAVATLPRVDFFHSSRVFIDGDGRALSGVHHSIPQVDASSFETGSPVKHLLCWRRSMGLAVGGMDESHSHGPDDFDFPWTMAQAGAVFHALDEPLYQYRDHREAYRLTTHVPLASQKWALRRIMKKHGMARERIRARVQEAEATYLRQSLFSTEADRRQRAGCDARQGWRDVYQ